jgi:hypothetical protein
MDQLKDQSSLRVTDPRGEEMKTPDDVSSMARLKALGWGVKRIAAELGCSKNTVKDVLMSAASTSTSINARRPSPDEYPARRRRQRTRRRRPPPPETPPGRRRGTRRTRPGYRRQVLSA